MWNTAERFGAGIEPTGNSVGAPARFTVETFSAGRGEVEVIVLNPKGGKEPVSYMALYGQNRAHPYMVKTGCVLVWSKAGHVFIWSKQGMVKAGMSFV